MINETKLMALCKIADVFFDFLPQCLCPSEGHKHGVSVRSSINSCGIFGQITQV